MTILRTLAALLLVLATAGRAEAACPWAGAPSVSATATKTAVVVNGQVFPVRGRYARASFEQTLYECGAGAAVPDFRRWRAARRATNITAVLSPLIWFPVPIDGGVAFVAPLPVVPPVTALMAGARKHDMLRAIAGSRPPGGPPVYYMPAPVIIGGPLAIPAPRPPPPPPRY